MWNVKRGKEWLLDKTFLIRFPCSPANMEYSNIFMRKVENFTNDQVKVVIIWNAWKIQSLFNNKDKRKHHICVIYYGICSCGANYIDETIIISEIRWNECITGKDKNSDCL